MYINKLKSSFSNFDKNGITSVDMIKIARSAGFHITRGRVMELVEAGIIPKPLMLNDSIGKGKRMSFNFDALTRLMIHLLVTKLVDGITKGSRYEDKDIIVAAGYNLAEALSNDLRLIYAQGPIRAMMLACQLVPVDLGNLKAKEASRNRSLIIKSAMAYAFIKTMIYSSNMQLIIFAWDGFKKLVVSDYSTKLNINIDCNFEDGLTKLAGQVGVVQEMLNNDNSGMAQKALVTCAQIIGSLENDSGWITCHMNDCLKDTFNVSIFEGKVNIDKLLSLTILKLG